MTQFSSRPRRLLTTEAPVRSKTHRGSWRRSTRGFFSRNCAVEAIVSGNAKARVVALVANQGSPVIHPLVAGKHSVVYSAVPLRHFVAQSIPGEGFQTVSI